MTKEEKELMKRFGITVEQKSVYAYDGHKYDQLKDAMNFAKIEAERRDTAREALEQEVGLRNRQTYREP